MEYRVVLHRGGPVESIGVRADDLVDLERSEVFPVEFLLRTERLDVTGVEPHFLADIELAGRLAFSIRILLLAGLGYADLGSQELVDLPHPRGELLGVPGSWGIVGYYRLEPHAGVKPIVSEERCHLGTLVQGVVQGELYERQPQCPVV